MSVEMVDQFLNLFELEMFVNQFIAGYYERSEVAGIDAKIRQAITLFH